MTRPLHALPQLASEKRHEEHFPSIFTLAIDGLVPLARKGSGLLVTAIFGGAEIPVLQARSPISLESNTRLFCRHFATSI